MANLPANFTKFFRNGKTFSAFCRMRYGQSKLVWEDTTLWAHAGQFAIGLDLAAADAKFGTKAAAEAKPAWGPGNEEWESERGLRAQEEMAAYIHSGAGLRAYYEDRDAGYAY